MHPASYEQRCNSVERKHRLTVGTVEKLSKLSEVIIKPRVLMLEPSYDEDKVMPFRIVNQTDSFISFKIRVTQSKFLTASPVFGVMEPFKGAVIILKLRRILDTSFVLSTDRVSVRLIFVPVGFKYSNPASLWKGPERIRDIVGRKALQVHYVRCISGTFTGKLIQVDENEKPLKNISHTPVDDSEGHNTSSGEELNS
ncbi:hypothetical protein M514_13241 [Trichuris suis]|uniref:MSP domain-containing protein n=1 Tax=Trichuris suis TaxID=68888 RepID=A0A085N546_9BILA|nr:hypothetical protein M513_13241 [Trichuris suis]KFD64592.1 hypothetical protein M514_13241 [Trichuris suis]KHJ40409.1 hypothetical protein D918_09550 [Trichuris suis]